MLMLNKMDIIANIEKIRKQNQSPLINDILENTIHIINSINVDSDVFEKIIKNEKHFLNPIIDISGYHLVKMNGSNEKFTEENSLIGFNNIKVENALIQTIDSVRKFENNMEEQKNQLKKDVDNQYLKIIEQKDGMNAHFLQEKNRNGEILTQIQNLYCKLNESERFDILEDILNLYKYKAIWECDRDRITKYFKILTVKKVEDIKTMKIMTFEIDYYVVKPSIIEATSERVIKKGIVFCKKIN